MHVDDLQMFGDQKFLEWITKAIMTKFACKDFSENEAAFLGMTVKKELNFETGEQKITLDANHYEDGIKEVVLTPERYNDKDSPLDNKEEADFRENLGKLMWLCRLTRPDLAFEAAASAQNYSEGTVIEQNYKLDNCNLDEFQNIPAAESSHVSNEGVTKNFSQYYVDDCTHMVGYNKNTSEVNKINIYREKKPLPEVTHIKIKNAIFLNKAIKKMKARQQIKIEFSDVLEGNLENLQIQVHCDSGSIMNMSGYKSQTGIMAVLVSKNAIKELPDETYRSQLNNKARTKKKNGAFIRACPIMWQSNKTTRVATSTFGGEIQSIYTAVDVGSVLRTLFSELLYGHARGKVSVVVKNDNLGLVHRVNSITAIPQEKRLNATLLSIRDSIINGEVDECDWISGVINLANGLTKSETGNDLHWLLQYNKLVVSTKKEEDKKMFATHLDKQYIMADNKTIGQKSREATMLKKRQKIYL